MRSSTAVLYDVTFSDTEVAVGERFTVSGTVRIMRSWPEHTVGPPETGFLSVIAPGPVVAVERREMNGVVTPQAVYIEKGATYDFRLDLVARRAGSWHVHPSFAVEGVGTLVGRGEWVAIADGEYTPTATALDGGTIDLSTVGLGRVVTWHLLGAALAVGWLAYWLRRPLLARLGAV
ncbi:MAG: monooxygenase, partial [Nocardioidaceae bacterium]|nr:monooxygenase [Nocardioidaceae bacterium]